MNQRLDDRPPDQWLRAAVDQSPDGLMVFDLTGKTVYASLGAFDGINPEKWVHEEDQERIQSALLLLRTELKPFEAEFRAVRPDGVLLWLEGKGYPVQVSLLSSLVAFSVRDITRRKQQEEQLMRLAYYDALTGLPNRRLFHDRLMQSLHTAKRYHRMLALLYLDLDDFKRINDTYGHGIGDELLTIAASRLTHSIREPDTVCRMGGDEFVVLLQHFEDSRDVGKIARRIADALLQPFDLKGQKIRITTSIGAAVYPEDGQDGELLLQNADAAMYTSKQAGKNELKFYSEL